MGYKIGNKSNSVYKGPNYHNPLRNRCEIIFSHRIHRTYYIDHFWRTFFFKFSKFFLSFEKKNVSEKFSKFS